jgi:hypothetical protein
MNKKCGFAPAPLQKNNYKKGLAILVPGYF